MGFKNITGVFGIALNKKGQYLLTKRHQPHTPWAHHKWQFPGGGVELHETPEETLTRELQEEIGIKDIKILFPHPIVKRAKPIKGRKVHITLISYLVDIKEQEITLEEHESCDYGWYSVNEIKQLETLPEMDQIVAEAEKIRLHFLPKFVLK